MIKFFRKIRQRSVTENKFSKYLLYAIGEIILVVIGILIALQFNNWKENSVKHAKQKIYFKNLHRDLTNQLISIDDQISYESNFVTTAISLLNYFNEQSFHQTDSAFFSKLSILQSRKTFVITDPTYTDLLSSGNIDIIENTRFKDKLIQYYQELERTEKIIQNNNSLFIDQQYASIFLSMGYYVSSDDLNTSKYVPKTNMKLRSTYENELENISKSLLKSSENKLKLMNVISVRHTTSLKSLSLMNDTKKITHELLQEFKKTTND